MTAYYSGPKKRYLLHPALVIGIYFGAAILLLAGCGEVDKVNGSLDQIGSMNDKMSTMSTDTGKVSSDSCELYDALRQDQALESRKTSLANIKSATDAADKMMLSGAYFMGFEFQLWSDSCLDTSKTNHDLLMASAAMEFTQTLPQFFTDQTDLSPDPSAMSDGVVDSQANLQASFNALAATVHLINPKQDKHLAVDPNFKEKSMLDILEQGIAAKAAIDSGKATVDSFPPQVKQVLLLEPYVIALLQARYNMAVAVVLNSISNVNNGFFTKLSMYLSSWDANLSKLNLAQIQEYENYVQGAVDTRNFLRANGYTPEMNSQFQRVLKNMNYKPDLTAQKGLQAEGSKLVKMIQDYANER